MTEVYSEGPRPSGFQYLAENYSDGAKLVVFSEDYPLADRAFAATLAETSGAGRTAQ